MYVVAALGAIAWLLLVAALEPVDRARTLMPAWSLLAATLAGTVATAAYHQRVAFVRAATCTDGLGPSGHATMIARATEEASHLLVLAAAVALPAALLGVIALARAAAPPPRMRGGRDP